MNHEDHDWLYPEESPSSVRIPVVPASGVWRFDLQCDRPRWFATLAEAVTAGPPVDPESTIESQGIALARACEERCEWALSDEGMRRVDWEAFASERERAAAE